MRLGSSLCSLRATRSPLPRSRATNYSFSSASLLHPLKAWMTLTAMIQWPVNRNWCCRTLHFHSSEVGNSDAISAQRRPTGLQGA